MNKYTFKVDLGAITEKECFKEASKDELKLLIAIASLDGASTDVQELAALTSLSPARVKSAITLFSECGVVCEADDPSLAEVEYEFGEEKIKNTSSDLAKSIRDNDLYELNKEMEVLFEKTLEARQIERITSLYTKKGLSIEYILTLAAFLKDKKQILTVECIVREATKLIDKDIDTLESLEVYIREKNREIAGEMEMRRLLGIYGRTLTKTERDFFHCWMHEYGYSAPIISEAYDITVSATGKMSVSYMNSILTSWHNAGCTTLEQCRAITTTRKYENSKKANNSSQKSRKTIESETPKYADFNSEDALLRAIERSYGQADEKDER